LSESGCKEDLKAIAAYTKAIGINSKDAKAYANQDIVVYAQSGNIQQAQQDLQTTARSF
jgi:histidinol phosphatase-like PHP family hydrolase